MKSIEFTEEQFSNLNEIGRELFNDENDPRSTAYIRKLKRPKINWLLVCICTLMPIIVSIALGVILNTHGAHTVVSVIVPIAIIVAYIAIMMKKAVICLVKIYQRYAPDSVRNKCRFEPSCSEYLILAIEKYGLVKGLKKGICRLKRCNIDGGGVDFP